MCKISIIVPFLNSEKTLENCMKSIKIQKYKDIEILLIDDGSTDNSKNKIEQYLKYVNTKYFYIKTKTIGVGRARNIGIEKATGDYLMFVDSDDNLEENLLENLKKYIEKGIELIKYNFNNLSDINLKTSNKIQVADNINSEKSDKNQITNLKKVDKIQKANNINLKKTSKIQTGEEIFNKICFKDKFLDSPCLYLIKKSLIKRTGLKFEENCYHEDFGFIPQLIINAKTMVLTNYNGYIYNQTRNSIIRNEDYKKTLKKIEDKIMLYDKMIENLEYMKINPKTKDNVKQYYTNSIIISLTDIKKEDRNYFINEINRRDLLKNIKTNNIKQMLKKVILSTNINFYLNLKERNVF